MKMANDSVAQEGKKTKARAQERKERAQTSVRFITTTEIARLTSSTTAGGIIRKAARQAKIEAHGWTQAGAIFLTVGRSARAKETNGTGMASDKGGRVLSD